MTARAAAATWPYPHRTVAEMAELEAKWRSRKPRVEADPLNDDALRTRLPTTACPYCQSRGWCGHAGRAAA